MQVAATTHIHRIPLFILAFLYLLNRTAFVGDFDSIVETILVALSLSFDIFDLSDGNPFPFLYDRTRPKVSNSVGLSAILCLLFAKNVQTAIDYGLLLKQTVLLVGLIAALRFKSIALGVASTLFSLASIRAGLFSAASAGLFIVAPAVLLVCLLWRLPKTFSLGEAIICSLVLTYSLQYSLSALNPLPGGSQLVKVAASVLLGTFSSLGLFALVPNSVSPLVFIGTVSSAILSLFYQFVNVEKLVQRSVSIIILRICIRWIGLLLFTITVTSLFVQFLRNPTPLQHQFSRKFYHFMAMIIFTPALLCDPEWTRFCFVMAACLFIQLEAFRLFCQDTFPSVSKFLTIGMDAFRNGLDAGKVVLSHFWLLFGCAVPVFAVNQFERLSTSKAMTGIFALGALDSMASIFGLRFGKLRWPGSNKTLLGSMAGAQAYLMAQYLLISFYFKIDRLDNLLPLFAQGIVCAIWEACCDQNDNITLPLVAYIASNLIPISLE